MRKLNKLHMMVQTGEKPDGEKIYERDEVKLDINSATHGVLGVDRIPSLPSSKITSGTIADARLPSKAKPADFVVEAGEEYRKWNSGIIEMWGQATASYNSANNRHEWRVPSRGMLGVPTTYQITMNYSSHRTLEYTAGFLDKNTGLIYMPQGAQQNQTFRYELRGKWK